MKKSKLTFRPDSIINDAWLGLGDLNELEIVNPLVNRNQFNIENPGLLEVELMRSPDYLSFAAKVLLGIEMLPEQSVVLAELWNRPFPMYIGSRGLGKTFMFGVLAVLRCALVPGSKIVGVGSGLRQSRMIFDYMVKIWNDSPVLRSVCNNESGPRTSNDRATFQINDSIATFLPIGDGKKIRGMRAHMILVDEFSSFSPEIFETVVSGFAAVSARPVDNVKSIARKEALKKYGRWTQEDEETFSEKTNNQIIITGTADYDFLHFAEYWRRYYVYIHSKNDSKKKVKLPNGDIKTLMDYFPEGVPPEFNYKDYSIMRIPYELIPKGFMDDKVIARAKGSNTNSSVYLKEYGACVDGSTLVLTNYGAKAIKDIVVGDMVLTHKNRFRKVTELFKRKYEGEIHQISSFGYNQNLLITPDHPIFDGKEDFIKPDKLSDSLYLSKLSELSGLDELDLRQYCTDYAEGKDFIFSGRQRKTNKELCDKINTDSLNGLSTRQISDKYGIPFKSVYQIQYRDRNHKRTKNSLPKTVKLNYDLGLCFGYYVSEGCSGADGRSLSFYLDGHVDTNLQYFVDQLSIALNNCFGIKPKLYDKGQNVIAVTINSRLLTEVFASICPGDCYSKTMNPDILYSNEEFLKGFIVGFWNGDGHKNKKFATSSSCSLNLASQVRMVLSYFDIASTLEHKKEREEYCFGQIRELSEFYKVNIYGHSYSRFLKIFYEVNDNKKDKNISFNESTSIFEIKENNLVLYNDFVYNIEVEEDHSYSLVNTTVHNCFPSDSDGFFKRSLIESCVANENNMIKGKWPAWCPHPFDPLLRGSANRKYVIAVDPAASRDNFAVVVLEIWPEHQRVVYVWSTNLEDFNKRKTTGLTQETEYYSFCARKIRNLAKVFPTEDIVIDGQGGGIAIIEALHDTDKLEPGEVPFWPTNKVMAPDKDLDTDGEAGEHIIHIFQFANADNTSEANHGTRKDLEDKVLLFPRFDAVSLELAAFQDGKMAQDLNVDRLYDTLEDATFEVDALKDELATIVMSKTSTGANARDRWDTPETTTNDGKKGRMRKDRYSALIMGNFIARKKKRAPKGVEYNVIGGFSKQISSKKENKGKKGQNSQQMYSGPAWYVNGLNAGVYRAINRK